MEYTLKEAAEQILHLHLCEQEGISSGMPTKEQWLKAVEDLEKALVRVPSSPVMSFEEFKEYCKNITGIEPEPIVKKRYEGYLIGTRSIVPEMTDEEIGVISRQEYNKLYGEIGTLSEWKLFARDCEIGLIAYRNWLRSQINK